MFILPADDLLVVATVNEKGTRQQHPFTKQRQHSLLGDDTTSSLGGVTYESRYGYHYRH